MSGRKSGEVAAVLQQSAAGRRAIENMLQGALDREGAQYNETWQKLVDLVNNLQQDSVVPDGAAVLEFPVECEALASQRQEALQKLRQIKPGSNMFNALLSEYEKHASSLAGADARAAKIRKAIAEKDWYCDAEYRDAQKVARDYDRIFSAQKDLTRRISEALNDVTQNYNRAVQQQAELQANEGNMRALENMAATKREARELRAEVSALAGQLDKDWAARFFPKEYAELQVSVEQLLGQNDNEFLSRSRDLINRIMTFASVLNEKISDWKRQEKDARDGLKNLLLSADISFGDPLEIYGGEATPTQIGLFSYLQEYAGASPEGEYKRLLSEIDKLLPEGNFAEVRSLLTRARELVANARDQAMSLQRNILEKTSLAGTLQDIMQDMGYDTELEYVGGNAAGGYKLTCAIGDEMITFEPIDVGEDGKVALNINHKESVGGNCANSWQKISKNLRNAGIPLTDVRLASGKSVLYGGKQQGKENMGAQMRQH